MKFLSEYGTLILVLIFCIVVAILFANVLPKPHEHETQIEVLEEQARVTQLVE